MSTTTIPVQLKTRREFCAHACQAASMLAIGAMAACSSPTSPGDFAPDAPTVSGSVSGNVVSVTVGSTVLASVGGLARVVTSLGSFLVACVGTDSYTAMTSVCTHEQCTITGASSGRFVCQCHGSQYNTSGGVVGGPAPSSLQQFATTFSGGVLSFTV